jgi:hypothetical protein
LNDVLSEEEDEYYDEDDDEDDSGLKLVENKTEIESTTEDGENEDTSRPVAHFNCLLYSRWSEA